jgi:putative transposase
VDETYAGINAQSSQVTLKRLDLAFASFFRRVKAGEPPGFPRYKSFARFSGWGYKAHGDGFRFTPGNGRQTRKHGALRLSGVGTVKVRGRARTPGNVKTCEIQHKDGRWYASLTIACEPQRRYGDDAIGLDWGVQIFATIAHLDGTYSEVENPRFVRNAQRSSKPHSKASRGRSAAQRIAPKRRSSLRRSIARPPTDGATFCTSLQPRSSKRHV